MTFVCLSIPPSPTGGARAAEVAARLLELVPRVRVTDPATFVWADARGLPARATAERVLDAGRAADAGARVGVAGTPIAAEVAARHGAASLVEVPAGEDRAFLGPLPLRVLAPAPELRRLMVGAGVERCRDLAGLDGGAVEIRFGAEGIALWRLARADDRRRLFNPMPTALPEASLEWTDYTLRDPEQLQFVVNRLAGSVTDALKERGQGAREVTLLFHLANRQTVERPFRLARVNADARTWMRLLRNGLEELRLPDAVTGVRLRVDAVAPSESSQGDLFDRGFATAEAAEAALARVVDEGSALVTPETSRHALPRRRTRWIERPPALVWARPQISPEDTTPSLALHLRPRPEPVEVETCDRRGHQAPLRYRARDGHHELVTASGPDCVAGGQWEDEPHAFELYCCVRMDGEIVLLARDARSGEWEVAGDWR